MEWNQFNRELQNRVSDPGVRYILGLIYERVLDLSKQQDITTDVTFSMANSLGGFMALNEASEKKVNELNRMVKGEHDGVDLRSVPLTNEERD